MAEPTLLSPAEVWDRVDPLLPDLHADPAVMGLGALPYQELRGPGFERLCYELLVAQGHSPRFFGRSGQKDYGVDLIVEADTRRTVYQCKNLAKEPSWAEIREAIATFEADWLGKAGLPPVNGFVYCCPHPLDDRSLGEEWTRFKDDFQGRTRTEVSFLDRRELDARLRRLPDLVAGLFSGSYAEHFCGRDGWLDDPWTRLQWGEARHASIARFLNRHQQGAIHVPDELEQRFRDLLSDSPVVAIRGLPGSGKTLTNLELVSQLRDPIRRIYYATLGSSTDVERLWQSVRRRSSLPAVFVLDDCHFDLEKTGLLLERLAPELSDARGRIKLLLILRDSVGSAGQLDDTPDWLLRLSQDLSVIDADTGLERTRAVTLHLRPELAGLSRQRLERLHYVTGGDLLLLDEALSNVSSPQDLDVMSPDALYGSLRSRYFRGNRHLPTIQKLACLAQFELVPMASFLIAAWLPGEKDLAAPLMTELFAPPRYQFLHSSLAELVLRALLSLESGVTRLEEAVAETTVNALVTYLEHLPASSYGGATDQPWFVANLETLLQTRLKLTQGPVEAQIKAMVLADETIRSAIEANLNWFTFSLLRMCVVVLSIADHPAKDRYVELIERRLGILFQLGRSDAMGMATVGTGFFTLARHAPSSLASVEREHGADQLFRLIAASGTLSELFRILQYATPTFRQALLDQLDEARAESLVDKAIASGRSIGTLGFTMRGLGGAAPELLGRLETAIGAERFLRLVAANGTLVELFSIVRYATPDFRLALLDRLDDDYAGFLINKTIASGRSIGTLNLAMRALGDADPVLLGRLEVAFGAELFLRLIAASGTLFELFRILEYATFPFRQSLLDQLNDPYAGALVDKTIAAGRSIGTLNFTMRELGKDAPVLLDHLETALGAERFLRLIAANGTLLELFRIMQCASPAFRLALLDRLDDDCAKTLVDKTIASGRPIGTLSFPLRELGNADPELLGRLETAIGAECFLRLITANGTLPELFKVLAVVTPAFRLALLDCLDEVSTGALVDKAISTRRSIGTLGLAMRELGDATPALLRRLETAIGAERFLRLITANGTLPELFKVLEFVTPAFRLALLDCLDEASTGALVDKAISTGRSIGTLSLAMRELGDTTPALLRRLETAIGAERFLHLIAANGTLVELFQLLGRVTPAFRQALLDLLDPTFAGVLVDKTIAAERPINSVHFTLGQNRRNPAQGGRLEELVGIDGWWRLMVGVGNLNSLSMIGHAMSDDFRSRFIYASSVLTVTQWCGITARGLFLNACKFASDELAAYPLASQSAFREALGQTAAPLAAKAAWFDLGPSRPPADCLEGQILREALRPRIEQFQVEDLVGLDFREAVNGFAFGWRERPSLRAALGGRLWDIVPEPAKWPGEDGEIASLRMILSIARAEEITLSDALRLLDSLASFVDHEVCAKMHTWPLFLLLWNMAALHFERRAHHSFDSALPDVLVQTLGHALRSRVQAKAPNEEKLAQLALGGLLGFLAPRRSSEIRRTLAPLTKSTKWLWPLALEQTFVPALFALEGLTLLDPRERLFTPSICLSLLSKSKDYEDVGPAIVHLRERVKRYSKRR